MQRTLTDQDVKDARHMHSIGYNCSEIARVMGVSKTTINYVVNRLGAYNGKHEQAGGEATD